MAAPLAAPPSGPKKRFVKINFILTDKHKAYLAKHFPGKDFKVQDYAGFHPHPISNLERREAEADAYYEISKFGTIVDIGGNASRHHAAGRNNVHSCCPILSPADVIRNSRYNNNHQFCTHKVSDCTCVVPDAYLSVHSLYYLKPDEICNLVNTCSSGTLMAVLHLFDGVSGEFCSGEARWERRDGKIYMIVEGNSVPYVHANMDWLNSGYLSLANQAMTWSQTNVMGSTRVYMFKKAPLGLKAEYGLPDLKTALSSNTYVGEVDIRGILNRSADNITPEMKELATSAGKLTCYLTKFLYDGRVSVIIPKNLLYAGILWMHGKPRDASTYRDLISYLKTEMRRLNLTEDVKAASLPYTAAFAFAAVEDEIDALQTIVMTKSEEINEHTASLLMNRTRNSLYYKFMELMSPTYRFRRSAVGVSIFGMVVAGFAMLLTYKLGFLRAPVATDLVIRRANENTLSVFSTINEALALSTVPIVLWFRNQLKQFRFAVESRLIAFRRHLVSVFHFNAPQQFVIPIPMTRTADTCVGPDHPLVAPYAKGSYDIVEFAPCNPKHGYTNFGPVPLGWPTIVYRSCQHNEIAAVVNRGLGDRGKDSEFEDVWESVHDQYYWIADPDRFGEGFLDCISEPKVLSWEEYGKTEIKPSITLFTDLRYQWISATQKWRYETNSRKHDFVLRDESGKIKLVPMTRYTFDYWCKRFPGVKQAELRKARSNPKGAVNTAIKAFVKREHTLKYDPRFAESPDPIQVSDPRLIQGHYEEFNAAVGPDMYSVQKYLAKAWNYTNPTNDTGLTYTSGMNAETLGAWCDFALEFIGRDGTYYVLEKDKTRLDLHVGMPAIRYVHSMYAKLGVEASVLTVLNKNNIKKGMTAHGVRYTTDGTVDSGHPDTNLKDTTVVGSSEADTYSRAGVDKRDYAAALTGDDNIAIVSPSGYQKLKDTGSIDHGDEYQLPGKILVFDDIDLAEYCSGRFWPTKHGRVFGPKIGRVLVKQHRCIHPYTEKEGRAWLCEVTYAAYFDHGHVPILRAVNAAMFKLLDLKTPVINPSLADKKIHAHMRHEVCPASFEMMQKLYDLDETAIQTTEQWIMNNFTQLFIGYGHPVLDRIIAKDTLDRYSVCAVYTLIPGNWDANWSKIAISPVLEEWFKKRFPRYWWAIPLYESIRAAFVYDNLLAAVLTWPLHWFFSKLPHPFDFIVHSYWNVVMIAHDSSEINL